LKRVNIDVDIKLIDSKLTLMCSEGEIELLPESFSVFLLKDVPGQKIQFFFDENDKIIKAGWILPDLTVGAEVIPF